MAKTVEDLYQAALLLSDAERARLAALLQDAATVRPAADIEQAWQDEIAHRAQLHANGDMSSVSWEDLSRELRARHGL